jgi:N-acetylmuramoyl-L-alanine amidase
MKVATRENSAIFYEDDYEKKYGGFYPESIESYIIMSNYTSAYVIQSANLAVKIQAEYIKKAGRIDKGVHRQSIWVLWRTSMPSILTEIGYLTNPLEEQFLGSEKGQEYLAKALFRGLRNYKDELAANKIVYNDEFENQSPLENENVLAGNIPGQKKSDKSSFSNKPIAESVSENTNSVFQAKDTVVLDNLNNEKATTAQEIALNFKKNKPAEVDDKTGSLEAAKTETSLPSFKIIEKTNEVYLVFKVLFASSGSPIDLKQEKYSVIKDGVFFIENKVLKYTSGSFGLIGEAIAHKVFLRNNGFNDCFVIALKNGERIDINEAKKLAAP